MRRWKSQLLPDFFGIQFNGWLQRICLLPQQQFHYRWENNSHSNTINLQLLQTTLVLLNLQTDLTTTPNFNVMDMHCGHRICLLFLLWSLFEFRLSVGPKYSVCLGIRADSQAILLRSGTAGPEGVCLLCYCSLAFLTSDHSKYRKNITKKWTFLIYRKWHETLRPTNASTTAYCWWY